MKSRFATTLAVISVLFSTVLWGQSGENEKNYIEVSARVERQVTPDEIYIAITISEKDNKSRNFVENKEREMVAALRSLGIDVEKNLTVKDMESSLKQYLLKKDNILATKSYTLKVGKASEVASLFQALNAIGISDITIERSAISPELEKKCKDELLAEAAKKAQENARILAEAVGCSAGKAIYIQNYYSFAQPYNSAVMMRSTKAMAAADNVTAEESYTLEVNKTNISITVTCQFRIE